jgi:hypothetical protein
MKEIDIKEVLSRAYTMAVNKYDLQALIQIAVLMKQHNVQRFKEYK